MTRCSKVVLAVLAAGLGLAAAWRALSADPGPQSRLQGRPRPVIASTGQSAGFARADGARPFDFPTDFGPHPDYQTEWWYYTGNLETVEGRRFGYQLTFFRRALVPPHERADRASEWAAEQIYMGHFALTDVEGNDHRAFERFSRGAAGLAGASSSPYRVWLEDWRVEQVGHDPGLVRMQADQEDLGIDLQLTDRRGPILQGDRGYSQKGPHPGNASYYYSQTRLETSGTVRLGDESFEVGGWSWKDHEFSTDALASDQVGWDWFALQLDDGSDLMVFQIRKDDGSVGGFSSGSLVDPDGNTQHLTLSDFRIEAEDTWRSPHTGASYPAGWTVHVPDADLELSIEPLIADQELNVSYAYWEGAVRIEGLRAGVPVRGAGYVELTGYAGSMQEQF